MADIEKKLSDEALEEAAGGRLNTGISSLPVSGGGGSVHPSGTTRSWRYVKCSVQSGYLALRSNPSYNYNNEMMSIYNGEIFEIDYNTWNGPYVWARYRGVEGWVNSNFIIYM